MNFSKYSDVIISGTGENVCMEIIFGLICASIWFYLLS